MTNTNLMNTLHNILVIVDSREFAEIEVAAQRTSDIAEDINLRNILADECALFIEYDEITAPDGTLLDEIPHLVARADRIANILAGICGLTAENIAWMLCCIGERTLCRFF